MRKLCLSAKFPHQESGEIKVFFLVLPSKAMIIRVRFTEAVGNTNFIYKWYLFMVPETMTILETFDGIIQANIRVVGNCSLSSIIGIG